MLHSYLRHLRPAGDPARHPDIAQWADDVEHVLTGKDRF